MMINNLLELFYNQYKKQNSEDIFYPTCDNCNHNMIPEYEYKHILARIKQESI